MNHWMCLPATSSCSRKGNTLRKGWLGQGGDGVASKKPSKASRGLRNEGRKVGVWETVVDLDHEGSQLASGRGRRPEA